MKRCHPGCECLPTKRGFYFATHREYGWRTVVEVGLDGFKKVRVHVARMSRSFGLEEFRDWYGPLKDRKATRA